MNKKRGFALIESIFMIVFLSVALLIVYKAFATSFQDEKRRINYDNTSSLYKTYFLKQYFEENNILTYLSTATLTNGYLEISCTTLTSVNSEYCNFIENNDNFNVKKVYITKYDMAGISYTNLEPTTIDYFRTLSGTDTTSYRIVVWYNDDEYASLKLGDPFYALNIILDGGTWNGETPQRIVSGDTSEISNPTKDGYIFTGWSVIGSGSSMSGTTFTMGNEDTVLLATWADNKLYNVRYVKDCANGSSVNNASHWVELQAIANSVNVASGKTVTGTTAYNPSFQPYSVITNGDTTSVNYAQPSVTGQLQCITVDLAQSYNLDEIKIWHYWADGRTYYSNTTYVSNDNTNWKPVIANTNAETSSGKSVLSSDTSTVVPIYRITNMVVNGSFENGSTGWTATNFTMTANSTYKQSGSYSMPILGTTTYAQMTQNVAIIAGNKYYGKVSFLRVGTLDNSGQYDILGFTAGEMDFATSDNTNIPTTSQWYNLSNIVSGIETKTVQLRKYTYSKVAVYTDSYTLIDLTSTFGAGKEPSKAWCDANLNYFDGTQNFNLTP